MIVCCISNFSKIVLVKQNGTFFMQEKYRHLTLSLDLTDTASLFKEYLRLLLLIPNLTDIQKTNLATWNEAKTKNTKNYTYLVEDAKHLT